MKNYLTLRAEIGTYVPFVKMRTVLIMQLEERWQTYEKYYCAYNRLVPTL
jgi:hypothetical protein